MAGYSVNTPPAKAGGFKLRLEAGLIGPSADYSLSHRERAGVRGSVSLPFDFDPLILTFSLREKE